MAWTDERMDDLASRMDAGFVRTDGDIRDLASRMDARFASTDGDIRNLADRMDARFARTDGDIRELRTEIGSLRTDMHVGFGDVRTELKGDIEALRTLTVRFGVALIVSLAGVIATLVGVVATGTLAA